MRLINGLLAVLGFGEIAVEKPSGNSAGTSDVAEVTSVESPAASLCRVDSYGKPRPDRFTPPTRIYSHTLPYVAILLVPVHLINCQPWTTSGPGEWREP